MENKIEQNSIKLIQNGIMEWQPIETCPEGYTVFSWLTRKIDKSLEERENLFGSIVRTTKHKDYSFGWYILDLDSVEKSLFEEGELYFSHWMPLPKSPIINNLTKK